MSPGRRGKDRHRGKYQSTLHHLVNAKRVESLYTLSLIQDFSLDCIQNNGDLGKRRRKGKTQAEESGVSGLQWPATLHSLYSILDLLGSIARILFIF